MPISLPAPNKHSIYNFKVIPGYLLLNSAFLPAHWNQYHMKEPTFHQVKQNNTALHSDAFQNQLLTLCCQHSIPMIKE